jgi:hypothetical protein
MTGDFSRRRFFQGLFGGLLAMLGLSGAARGQNAPSRALLPGPSGVIVPGPSGCFTYTYDSLGRLTGVTEPPLVTTSVYEVQGALGEKCGDMAG